MSNEDGLQNLIKRLDKLGVNVNQHDIGKSPMRPELSHAQPASAVSHIYRYSVTWPPILCW